MRIISDELYAQVLRLLMQDEKVALFQKLVTAPTAEQTGADEIKINEVDNGIQQSNAKSKNGHNGN